MSSEPTLGSFTIIQTIGNGASSEVKLVFNTQTQKFSALKVLSPFHIKHFTSEVSILSRFSHPSLISLLSHGQIKAFPYALNEGKTGFFLELEYCPFGDLFQYVKRSGGLPETVARWTFRHMISGVAYMHSQGFAHLDLKPENILFDSSLHPRICDFGFSHPLLGTDGSGFLRTRKGTRVFKAPEVLSLLPFRGDSADVFSLSVTLFIMVTGFRPFHTSDILDSFYHFISCGKWVEFWELHQDHLNQPLDPQFKDLMERTLCMKPEKRLSCREILKHGWMMGVEASEEEAKTWYRGMN